MISAEQADEMSEKLDVIDSYVDDLCQKSQSFYNPFPEVQALLKSKVERIVDKQLAISFNFARIYWPGDVLPKHIDRDACEWSLTLNLRNEGDPWPFYVKPEKESDVLKFIMNPGDAVVYHGPSMLHWRDELESDAVYQAFMHFVDINGEYTDHIMDAKLQKRGLSEQTAF